MIRRASATLVAAIMAITTQGILGLGGISQANAPTVNPTLSPCSSQGCEFPPPSDRTKIKSGDSVKFGGTASGGSSVISAEIFFHRADGVQHGEPLFAKVTTTPLATTVLLGGSKTGLNLVHASLDGGWLELEVTVEDAEGQRATGRSNRVYIDNSMPSITGMFLTSTGEIEVRFSEPVLDPTHGDQALDWAYVSSDESGATTDHYWNETNEFPFEGVSGSGAIRRLAFASDWVQDQDATPAIRYRPLEQHPATNPLQQVLLQYRDHAGWRVVSETWYDPAARDLVPPEETPAIDSIEGVSPGTTAIPGTDQTPEIVVSNLRAEEGWPRHRGRIYLETGESEGFQATGDDADALIGEAIAQADGTATIDTEGMLGAGGLPDGEHVFYAVATDRAKCNPPQSSQECPNSGTASDGAKYSLDTIAPLPLSAELKAPNGVADEIAVRFSEGIAPAGERGLWSVSANGFPIAVQSVGGSGDTRTLKLASEATQLPVLVSWEPAGDGYADGAGNALGAFDALNALNDVPLEITLSAPALTKASTVTLQGAVTHGLTPRDPAMPATVSVDVFVDADGDAVPDDNDGDDTPDVPVQTLDATSGSFQTTFPLPADGTHAFSAIGHRNQPGHETLPVVDSTPVTVQVERDTKAPIVTISPLERDAYSGWSESNNTEITVSWSATDAGGFASGSAVMLWRPSAAVDWIPRSTDLSFTTTVENGLEKAQGVATFSINEPIDTGPNPTAEIQIRITDQVDWTGMGNSTEFRIDSTPPEFTATTIDTQRVRVRFTEAVQGASSDERNTLNPEEWRLQGKLAQANPSSGETLNFVLQALTGEGWDTNGKPIVSYVPLDPPRTKYRDVALNPIQLDPFIPALDLPLPRKDVPAADAIAPGAPTLNATPGLVDRGSIPLTGTGDGTPVNQVVVRRVGPSEATYSSVVNSNGTFGVLAGLEQNAVNVFRVSIEDEAGNSSAVRQLVVSEDSSGPLVTVKDRKKRIRAKKKALVAQWTSVEPHPGFSALYLEFRKRNGRTRMLTIADQTVDDGREKARFPKKLRKKMRKGKIKAIRFHVFSFDALGHAGSDTGRWVKVRGKRRRR